MRKKIIGALSAVSLMAGSLGADPFVAASSVNLRQCFEWATARSESLQEQAEDVAQANARARQAIAAALPQLSWDFAETWQDPSGVDQLSQQGFGGFVAKTQADSSFAVTQTLFSGFREILAKRGFERQRQRDTLRLEWARRELFENASDSFYAVIALENQRDNLQTTIGLSGDRLKELREFRRLGKSRDSEIFAAEARLAALQASLQQTAGRIDAAREDLSLLTSHDLTTATLLDELPATPPTQPLESLLKLSEGRSDLQAQRQEVEAQGYQVRYERASYWPKADVTGRYYTQRATYIKAIDWDIVLALHVPIFQGGAVDAHVKEALSQEHQATLVLESMQRQVYSVVRKTHRQLLAAYSEIASLQQAAEAAQKSYDALRKEYRLGLVTNLEVLEALDLLQTQKNAFDDARVRAKQLHLQLGVATEQLP